MKRILLLVGAVGASGVAIAAAVVWYLSSYQTGGGSVQAMMGQMMGNTFAGGMVQPMPWWFWALLVSLVVVMVAGVIGLGYYAMFPEIRSSPGMAQTSTDEMKGGGGLSWSTLVKTSKPEERKVLEVLAAHDGRYLQKFVVKEAGLSRLMTHRIVSRFVERGVVTVERKGNTKEIALAEWLKADATGVAPSA